MIIFEKHKHFLMRLFILSFVIMCSSFSFAQQKVKIACVGNSITYGARLNPREKNSYPGQLQAMLGNEHQVMNFGVSGTTLLRNGNSPYWKTEQYNKALQSNPDIVFIKLGTNDSKAINRKFYSEFETDYANLIDSFQLLPTKPRVILLLPVVSFEKDSNQIYDPVITKEIIPRIRKIAYEKKCELLDLHPMFLDKVWMIPDAIHPSSIGATLIAQRLYEYLQLKEKQFDIFSKIKEEKKFSSFFGFDCADFTFNNRNCKVVKPRKAVQGLPWVWRARFWGHEPQTDIALLERGFHVVYCDVAELFGNKEAIALWNVFYKKMVRAGLHKKTVLEAVSRGGVYAYNWAAANPGKVACVYADAPVLDLKSWPGGKGKSKGSASDWEQFKKDYNYNSEEEAASFKGSPLDKVAAIVKGKFPMLHVVGDADEVVPVDENTNPFEAKIKNAGGNITVIHKPGIKHHPHSLENPKAIVDFILSATGYKINFAAIAAPGSEYRSAAGWKEGTDWWTQNDDINTLLKNNRQTDIVFIGNSITQGIAGERPSVTYKPGKAAFDKAFSGYNWISAGISGDRTQHILWRLQNGSYAAAKPKVAVLAIGVNNFADDSGEEAAKGIHEILQWMKKNMPATKIILIGTLPCGVKKDDAYRKKYETVQAIIRKYKQKNLMYLPLANTFIRPDGNLDLTLCSGDGIHLVEKGYEMWANTLKDLVEKLIKK